MKVEIIDVQQKSDAWLHLRKGKLTGSQVAAACGCSPHKSNQGLMKDWLGINKPFQGNAHTAHGEYYEPVARAKYEDVTGNLVREVGFAIFTEAHWLALSPDGLVGDKGCIEIKCPSTKRTYGGVPDLYLPQCIMLMEGFERDWCDFVVYHPEAFSMDSEKDEPESMEVWRVQRNPGAWEWMLKRMRKWYGYYLRGQVPPRDPAKRQNAFPKCEIERLL